VSVVKEANAANIPIINFNTPDPQANFNAYVGGDNVKFGRGMGAIPGRQQAGEVRRLRLDGGRGPRRNYGVQEEQGISSVFKPLNITWEVTDSTLDQAEIITACRTT